MAKAIVINKQLPLSLLEIIKFQLNFYCFNNKIRLSPAQLDCLSLLGLYGEINMADFCVEVVNQEIFGNVQTTRNFITKCCKDELVVRTGLGNKFLANIREADAICEVVRVFEDANVTHVAGKIDPQSDIKTIETELALKDLETVEKRLQTIEKDVRAGDKSAIRCSQILKNLISVCKDIFSKC